MVLLRHRRIRGNGFAAVSHHRELGHVQLGRIRLAVCWGRWFASAPCVKRKEEAKLETRIGDEFLLLTFEGTCLDLAAVSVTRCHVQDMVFANEVVHRDLFAALINAEQRWLAV